MSALWVGPTLGCYERLCLSSFAAAGYQVSLYTYRQPTERLPEIEYCDAREILDEGQVFEDVRHPGTYASFADRFRYRLLQVRPTTWVDADVLKVGVPLPDPDYLMGYEDETFVNNAVLRAPPESQLLARLNEHVAAVNPASISWGGLGPKLLTSVVKSLGLSSKVQPPSVLYPIPYWEVYKLFSPRFAEEVERVATTASTIHLWNEVLRTANRDVKHARPPKGSFLANALADSKIQCLHASELDVRWVEDDWARRLESRRLRALRRTSRLLWSLKERRRLT